MLELEIDRYTPSYHMDERKKHVQKSKLCLTLTMFYPAQAMNMIKSSLLENNTRHSYENRESSYLPPYFLKNWNTDHVQLSQ